MVQFIYRDVRKLETFRDSRFSVLVSPSEPVPTFVGLSLEVFFTPNRNQFISLGLGLSYFFFGSVPTKMYRESFHCGQFEATSFQGSFPWEKTLGTRLGKIGISQPDINAEDTESE